MITREKRDIMLMLADEPVNPDVLHRCLDCKRATFLIRKKSIKISKMVTEGAETREVTTYEERLETDTHCEHFNALMDDIIYHCERFEPVEDE